MVALHTDDEVGYAVVAVTIIVPAVSETASTMPVDRLVNDVAGSDGAADAPWVEERTVSPKIAAMSTAIRDTLLTSRFFFETCMRFLSSGVFLRKHSNLIIAYLNTYVNIHQRWYNTYL